MCLSTSSISRTWFVDTWNTSLAVSLRSHLSDVQAAGVRSDPLHLVVRSWPWRDDVSGLPKALEAVFSDSETAGSDEEERKGQRMKPEGAEDPLVIDLN